jgi:gamma-glutamylcyclotransferase (GGCT)/AIG2-like uncharacterized protein YtfP
MTGRVRWPLLAPYVAGGPRTASVPGRLYDTGRDYPAARFDVDGTIHGELFRLELSTLEAALAHLDEIEGAASGYYRRVVVTTDDGEQAWAYEFGGAVDRFVDLDGRWTGV